LSTQIDESWWVWALNRRHRSWTMTNTDPRTVSHQQRSLVRTLRKRLNKSTSFKGQTLRSAAAKTKRIPRQSHLCTRRQQSNLIGISGAKLRSEQCAGKPCRTLPMGFQPVSNLGQGLNQYFLNLVPVFSQISYRYFLKSRTEISETWVRNCGNTGILLDIDRGKTRYCWQFGYSTGTVFKAWYSKFLSI
jgi:hypothetical protein